MNDIKESISFIEVWDADRIRTIVDNNIVQRVEPKTAASIKLL